MLLQGPLERDLVSKLSLCGALPDLGNRNASPMVVTLVAFFHFAVIRNQTLTPSVAFASVRFLFRHASKDTLIGCHFRSLVSLDTLQMNSELTCFDSLLRNEIRTERAS